MPRSRRCDAAGESCFLPSAAGANRSPGRHGRDLQSGTRSEGRYAGFEHSSHQIDFPPSLRRVLVKVKRRAGHEDRIIALQPCPVRQNGPSVRSLNPMANCLGREKAQGVDVCFAGAAPSRSHDAFPGLRAVHFPQRENATVLAKGAFREEGAGTAGRTKHPRPSSGSNPLLPGWKSPSRETTCHWDDGGTCSYRSGVPPVTA